MFSYRDIELWILKNYKYYINSSTYVQIASINRSSLWAKTWQLLFRNMASKKKGYKYLFPFSSSITLPLFQAQLYH